MESRRGEAAARVAISVEPAQISGAKVRTALSGRGGHVAWGGLEQRVEGRRLSGTEKVKGKGNGRQSTKEHAANAECLQRRAPFPERNHQD
eukprot:6191033-Pleurochrysis_carterae.AAC.3